MKILRRKRRTLVVTAVILGSLVMSTAGATHVFDDVADSRFFAEPVKWAADNMITTGTSATTFEPDRGVTRGESVTFLKRYHDNVVEPALADRYTTIVDRSLSTSVDAGAHFMLYVLCQSGEEVVGGGYSNATDTTISGNYPTVDPTTARDSWYVGGTNTAGFDRLILGHAVCVS